MLLVKQKTKLSKTSLLNIVGNFTYFISLWLMLMLVVRILDFQSAGIFSIAITLGNLFSIVSIYGLRLFQVSDINKEYSDQQYMLARLITIPAGFVFCAVYVVISGYGNLQSIIIVLFMIYKSLESFSDLCYAYYQNHGNNFNYICTSLCIKGIIQLGVFYFGLIIFEDLRYAIGLASASILIIIISYDLPRIINIIRTAPLLTTINWKSAIKLLVKCSPMVIVLLSTPILQAIPRIYFESQFSAELFGIFSAVSAPTMIFVVFISSALVPFIPMFSEYYNRNDHKGLMRLLLLTTGLTLALGILSLIAALFLGEWVLVILYGDDIRPWSWVLYSIIIATVLTSLLSCFISLFTAVRKLISLAIVMLIGCVICYIFTPYMVDTFEMDGIAFAMITGQTVIILLFTIQFLWLIHRMRKPHMTQL